MPITYPPETLSAPKTVTANYTLAEGDNLVEVNSGTGKNVTIPAGLFTVGRTIAIRQLGAGAVTIVAGGGVTLRLPGAHNAVTNGQYATAYIHQRAADEWVASGDLT